jgi:hypothetical protein
MSPAYLVEVDVVDPDGSVPAAQTLIVESYDGTPAGAVSWALDVLDWCEVSVRSVRRVHGALMEARSEGRLDAPPAPAG